MLFLAVNLLVATSALSSPVHLHSASRNLQTCLGKKSCPVNDRCTIRPSTICARLPTAWKKSNRKLKIACEASPSDFHHHGGREGVESCQKASAILEPVFAKSYASYMQAL
jgi:hypothetical protein